MPELDNVGSLTSNNPIGLHSLFTLLERKEVVGIERQQREEETKK
jgi:hypothetical protein